MFLGFIATPFAFAFYKGKANLQMSFLIISETLWLSFMGASFGKECQLVNLCHTRVLYPLANHSIQVHKQDLKPTSFHLSFFMFRLSWFTLHTSSIHHHHQHQLKKALLHPNSIIML